MWGALISGGLNLASSWIQANAAKKAAEQQALAAQGIADRAGQTAGEYGGYIAGAGNIVGGQILDETRAGQTGVAEGVISANDILRGVYGDAAAALNPYMAAGQAGLTGLTDVVNGPGFNFQFDPNEDPSYQFREAQGLKALERSAAAKGGALGGAAVKSAMRYSSDLASTEYQNSYARAFQKFQAERQAISCEPGWSQERRQQATSLAALSSRPLSGSRASARAASSATTRHAT
jgi:hypothetical protein